MWILQIELYLGQLAGQLLNRDALLADDIFMQPRGASDCVADNRACFLVHLGKGWKESEVRLRGREAINSAISLIHFLSGSLNHITLMAVKTGASREYFHH